MEATAVERRKVSHDLTEDSQERERRARQNPGIGALLDRLDVERARLLRDLKVTVIVAHPDDEAIGAGALLRGIDDVRVVYVTDGAPSDQEYAKNRGFASREAYAETRRDEARAALWIIGVPPEKIHGLGLVDGDASLYMKEICLKLAAILKDDKPDVILTHPYEGGHSDHDATAFGVHLACGLLKREGIEPPVIIEMTSYHNYEGKRRMFDFLPGFGNKTKIQTVELSVEAQETKRQMFEAFVSQQDLLKTVPVNIEKFRPAPRYLFIVPPHEGRLDYELRCKRWSGQEWRLMAKKALQELGFRSEI